MSILTDLTKMRLTRSREPFVFRNEADAVLPYADCENLGLYAHIPFCRSLCSFCPYCKVKYEKGTCDRYIDALINEIHLIGAQNSGRKTVTSLYFGGGTPALAADRLAEIADAVREHFVITDGIGAELHPDDVTPSVLRKLKDAGVTKISVGVQSFEKKFQRLLGRDPVDAAALRAALAEVPFETVSVDFIFALPGQTFGDLKADLDTAFSSGANHAALYPFIDFRFTPGTVKPVSNRKKRALMDAVADYCASNGWERTTIWTYAKGKGAKYSSMTRDNFLGFGCSAATLLRDQFKINTFSVDAYCERIGAGALPTSLTLRFSERQRMVYYLFWTAYGMTVDPEAFERFFGVPLKKMYGPEIKLAQILGFIRAEDGSYRLTPKGAFYFHYYENYYTLAYIDKMWGILRREAFPEEIRL